MRDRGGRRPRAGGGVAPKRRCLGSIFLEVLGNKKLSTVLECLISVLNSVTVFRRQNNTLNNNNFIVLFYCLVNPL